MRLVSGSRCYRHRDGALSRSGDSTCSVQTCHRQCHFSHRRVGATKFSVPVIPPLPSVDPLSVHLEDRGTRPLRLLIRPGTEAQCFCPTRSPVCFYRKDSVFAHLEARCENEQQGCSSGSTVSHQERPLTSLGSPCPRRTGWMRTSCQLAEEGGVTGEHAGWASASSYGGQGDGAAPWLSNSIVRLQIRAYLEAGPLSRFLFGPF